MNLTQMIITSISALWGAQEALSSLPSQDEHAKMITFTGKLTTRLHKGPPTSIRVGSGPPSGAVFQLFLESQTQDAKTKVLSKLNAVSMCTARELFFNVEATFVVGWRS